MSLKTKKRNQTSGEENEPPKKQPFHHINFSSQNKTNEKSATLASSNGDATENDAVQLKNKGKTLSSWNYKHIFNSNVLYYRCFKS